MATEVLMPKLGLTMTEGTIEEWKYKEGDAVKKGDILFSVATDKLTNPHGPCGPSRRCLRAGDSLRQEAGEGKGL